MGGIGMEQRLVCRVPRPLLLLSAAGSRHGSARCRLAVWRGVQAGDGGGIGGVAVRFVLLCSSDGFRPPYRAGRRCRRGDVHLHGELLHLWGNTLSTLAGEFSFSWSFALSLVYLGLVIRSVREGRGFTVGAGVILALTALSHIITTMVVILASLPLLLRRRGPSTLFAAWGIGFALAAFWAVAAARSCRVYHRYGLVPGARSHSRVSEGVVAAHDPGCGGSLVVDPSASPGGTDPRPDRHPDRWLLLDSVHRLPQALQRPIAAVLVLLGLLPRRYRGGAGVQAFARRMRGGHVDPMGSRWRGGDRNADPRHQRHAEDPSLGTLELFGVRGKAGVCIRRRWHSDPPDRLLGGILGPDGGHR